MNNLLKVGVFLGAIATFWQSPTPIKKHIPNIWPGTLKIIIAKTVRFLT